jgi:hypothetical protein
VRCDCQARVLVDGFRSWPAPQSAKAGGLRSNLGNQSSAVWPSRVFDAAEKKIYHPSDSRP